MIELPWVIFKSKPYFHWASKRPIYEAADHSQVSWSLGILQGLQPAYMDDDRAWDMGYQRRSFFNPTAASRVPEFPGFQVAVPVFRADKNTVHHAQTKKLKPKSHAVGNHGI